MIGFTVVGNPAATVMTSSPGIRRRSPSFGDVSAVKATKLAEEPELTSEQLLTPIKRASFFSNAFAKRPVVNQQSRAESTTERRSAPSMTLPETGTGGLPGLEVVQRERLALILNDQFEDLLSELLGAFAHQSSPVRLAELRCCLS
jgi:hypothetical protein